MTIRLRFVTSVLAATLFAFPGRALAHCDSLNGPVVAAARIALEKRDILPILKWLKDSDEAEARRAFQQTIAVREVSAAARELADRFFFETVVRLHRAGEGEPYTGLKDTAVDEAIALADKAVATGALAPLVDLITTHAVSGIRERLAHVRELQAHAETSVADGRRYVEAYVEFIHYIEQLGGDPDVDVHTPTDPVRR